MVLAHLGSFVAAKSLRLSPISNLLTCLRTQDSLTTGESAFIWQQRYLNEKVIAQADKQSLVLLDEISSGTSGYRDGGESLAAGVLLYTVENCGCFCLFASHFEYLPSIPSHNKVSGIKNIHPKKDSKGWSTFKMVPGKGRSDGLEAVKKHIPDFNPEVIKKAEEARLTIEALRKQKS